MNNKANRTSFKAGFDARRHRFTRKEQRKGHASATKAAYERGWDLAAWLYRRVRGYYRQQGQWRPSNAKLTGRK